MEWVGVVAALALIEYMVFGGMVGAARAKYGVEAPAVVGPPEFERRYRVHQNTVEQLIVFLPALFLFASYVNPSIAAGVGLVFVIGRVLYMVGYVRDPASRTIGFVTGYLATVVLVLGGAIGAAWAALT